MKLALPILLLTLLGLSFLIGENQPQGRYYNCSLVEISPDYPVQVKEECRRANVERIRQTKTQRENSPEVGENQKTN